MDRRTKGGAQVGGAKGQVSQTVTLGKAQPTLLQLCDSLQSNNIKMKLYTFVVTTPQRSFAHLLQVIF